MMPIYYLGLYKVKPLRRQWERPYKHRWLMCLYYTYEKNPYEKEGRTKIKIDSKIVIYYIVGPIFTSKDVL